tara:strand:- start:157 stop:498 length:342 start_codon:yes stop_codon:yes gene_type:complete
MNNNLLGQVLGYFTASVNFILYLPQVIHVFKVKDTKSLDTNFLLLQMLSCTSTLSYGMVIHETPIVVSSISILASTLFLGYAKWILYSDTNIKTYNYLPVYTNNKNEINPLKN